jgi:hypothetical protein
MDAVSNRDCPPAHRLQNKQPSLRWQATVYVMSRCYPCNLLTSCRQGREPEYLQIQQEFATHVMIAASLVNITPAPLKKYILADCHDEPNG